MSQAKKPRVVKRNPPKTPEFADVGGRPKHEVTETSRNLVRFLRIAGYTQAQVAAAARIHEQTLRLHYRDEIDNAKPIVDAKMANTLVMLGTGGNGPDAWKNANIAACIFYHKAFMGKTERSHLVHSGAVGSYDLSKLTDEQLDHLERILALAGLPNSGNGEGGAATATS